MDINQLFEFLGNHLVLTVALLVVIVMIVANEFNTFRSAAFQISVDDAVKKYNKENAQFVDLRPPKNFEDRRIINAINLPTSEVDSRLKMMAKYKKQMLILYSQAGLEVAPTRQKLESNGFEVFELRGGFDAWLAQNQTIETDKKTKQKVKVKK